jgi:Fur family peroxide stress response transcriptional regulator
LTTPHLDDRLSERLAARGFRATSHREHVYHVLLAQPNHPTAEQVFMRAKKARPDISLATVYNCLEILVKSGLVREVQVDRAATRYCPNMQAHGHFYCQACGAVLDVPYADAVPELPLALPKGLQVSGFEVSIRGVCSHCAPRRAG